MKHFLYGLDVDFIMLGLGSKKIHFTLLRKKLIENEKTQGKSLLMGSGEKKWHGLAWFYLWETFTYKYNLEGFFAVSKEKVKDEGDQINY